MAQNERSESQVEDGVTISRAGRARLYDAGAHLCDAAREPRLAAGHTHWLTVAIGLPEGYEGPRSPENNAADREARPRIQGQPVLLHHKTGVKHSLHACLSFPHGAGQRRATKRPSRPSTSVNKAYAELVKLRPGGKPVITRKRPPRPLQARCRRAKEGDQQADERILLLCSPSNLTGTVYTPG